jgi:HAD superfamily hydrolase (TIGR01549 family)
MAQFKAVFFDVKGTLWDANACALHVLEIVLPKFTPPLPEEPTADVIRRFNAVFLDMPRKQHLRDRRPFSRVKRFEALLESYGVRRRDKAHEMSRTFDSVRRMCIRQFLRPDTHHVLGELNRRGLQRGVIMNGSPAAQRHLLQSLGIETCLELVVLGEVEGYSKPDRRLFTRALTLAGVQPEEALYVGDSPVTDILGASRAGIPTVWFNTGRRRLPEGFPAPDYTVGSAAEVLAIADF